MSQTKKPFDLESFFRKRIKAAEDAGASQQWNEPDDGMWDQIEQALPEHNPFRYRFLPWIIGITLCGMIVWLYMQNRSLKQEIALLEQQSIDLPGDSHSMVKMPDDTAESDLIKKPEDTGIDQQTRINDGAFGKIDTEDISHADELRVLAEPIIQKSDTQGTLNSKVKSYSKATNMVTQGENDVSLVENPADQESSKKISQHTEEGPVGKHVITKQSMVDVNLREERPVNVLPSANIIHTIPDRKIQVPHTLPNVQFIEPVQKNRHAWQLSIGYEPSFAKLKNTTQYPDAPEFRGINDLGVWSDAFSVRLSRNLNKGLQVFSGIRYGAYQYQTAYYIALPYDPLLEVEGNDGNFTSDFSHSFPSPVGDVEANFGLLRLAEDDIEPQTILNLDLHARHKLKLIEIPLGVSKSINISKRFNLTGSLSLIPGIVTGKESTAYAFESHHQAMHHRYSGFKGKTKAYNHLTLSSGVDLRFSYLFSPQIGVFAGGGFQAGLTNVYSDLNVHSKIRAYRMSFGITNYF